MPDQLLPNESLGPDQFLTSLSGRFTFVYQGDGNLVIYGPPPNGEYIWDSATDGNPGSRLVVQDDGNVVIYRPDSSVVWATNTVQPNQAQGDTMQPSEALFPDQSIRSADGRYTFVYQGVGNLVLYGPFGALWASNTAGRPAGNCVMQGDGNLVIYGPPPNGEYIWDSATDGNPAPVLSSKMMAMS